MIAAKIPIRNIDFHCDCSARSRFPIEPIAVPTVYVGSCILMLGKNNAFPWLYKPSAKPALRKYRVVLELLGWKYCDFTRMACA